MYFINIYHKTTEKIEKTKRSEKTKSRWKDYAKRQSISELSKVGENWQKSTKRFLKCGRNFADVSQVCVRKYTLMNCKHYQI